MAFSIPSLSVRDFIQNIFPPIIAISLFAPFFPSLKHITFEAIIIVGAIIGYISYPVIENFIKLPNFPETLSKYRERAKWNAANWDYTRFFFTIDKDDREYLNLLGGYIKFCIITGIVLFVYILFNFYVIISEFKQSSEIKALFTARTKMLGDWQLSSLVLIIISCFLSYFLFKKAISEYKELFFETGNIVILAGEYHQKNGNIAKKIWGRLIRKQDSNETFCLNNYKVILEKANEAPDVNKELDCADVKEDGYFQFNKANYDNLKTSEHSSGKLLLCIQQSDSETSEEDVINNEDCVLLGKNNSANKSKLRLVIKKGNELTSFTKDIEIKEKKVPYFEIEVS